MDVDLDPPAVRLLAGMPYEVVRHPTLRTAEDLERALGWDREQMVKTLAFDTGADRLLLVCLVSTDRVAYGRVARLAGVPRARLRAATAEQVRRLGMEPGGITPLSTAATVVFDARVDALPVLYCGTGLAEQTLIVDTELVRAAVRPRVETLSRAD